MPARSIRDEIKQRRPFPSAEQEAIVALLRTASDVAHRIEAMVSREGLTQPQYNVLRILRGADGTLPTMEVAARMVTPTPGITRLIDRLATRGLVRRVPCGEDRRRTFCAITDEGVAALDRLDPVVTASAREVMRGLRDEDLATLLRLLAEVREGMRTAEGHPTV
ncbi:MAG TPA: MarR family transcriptional regulator [Anaeromyxobacteraceae bacterium]|nr:MarR family transcriptional regulator [Anaeromyxobacteraceae bacterium]